MLKRHFMKVLIAGLILIFNSSMLHAAGTGVVFLHAKGSSPDAGTITPLIKAMKQEGMEVIAPELPWSDSREYDASYEDALREINKQVEALKAKGITNIIIAGHSLGANAAIAYAANYTDAQGVAAIAPGHVPELKGYQKKLGDSVKKARHMVSSGKGDKKVKLNDVNQGKKSSVKTTPEIYLSYFDPQGPAVIPNNVMAMNEGTALLWIVGEKDRMAKRGEDYAFSMAVENPLNEYIVVKGDHKDTPKKGQDEIIAWIRQVSSAQ